MKRNPNMRAMTLKERFFAKVDKLSQPGHWLWMGSINPVNGYGKMRVGSAFLYVHRMSLSWKTGNEGVGLDACHSNECPFRHCVNPDCLSWKTHQENTLDIIDKYGRLGKRRKVAQTPLPIFKEAA
jgi:hypothetical protein